MLQRDTGLAERQHPRLLVQQRWLTQIEVDPANRLVAESKWNDKLRLHAEAAEEYESCDLAVR